MQRLLKFISQVCGVAPNAGLYTLVLIRASLEGTKAAGLVADAVLNDLRVRASHLCLGHRAHRLPALNYASSSSPVSPVRPSRSLKLQAWWLMPCSTTSGARQSSTHCTHLIKCALQHQVLTQLRPDRDALFLSVQGT